jgi:DNA-binding response OmpR family regulator
LVEDEWIIAELLQMTLETAGYQVVGPAGRVADALDAIAHNSLSAAVLDVSLRTETSIPIARVLAENAIPFIFTTGYTSASLPNDLKDRPILNKPVDDRKLLAALNALLQTSTQISE